MNDDEFPETVEPFLSKLKKYKKEKKSGKGGKKDKKKKKKQKNDKNFGDKLAFLKDWKTPVTEDNMEQLTGPGAEDSKALGQRMGSRYQALIPELNEPAIK